MNTILILLICLSSSHRPEGPRDTVVVDAIELNHFYDEYGRLSYKQLIFYEWSPDYCRYDVLAWALIEDGKSENRMPIKRGEYWICRTIGTDGSKGSRMTTVRSKVLVQSHTTYDPERRQKLVFDEKFRLGLGVCK